MPEGTPGSAPVVQDGPGRRPDAFFDEVSAGLRISTAVVVVSGYLALVTTSEYGPDLLIVPAAMLLLAPLAERFDTRFKMYGYVTSAIAAVFAFAAVASVAGVGLLPAVTWLVVFIQGYKLCHRKGRRDYYQVFLMAFFLLVAGCAQDPEASIGLVMALFLVGSVWAFMLVQIRGEASASGNGALPDIVPLGVAGVSGPLAVSPGVVTVTSGGRGLAVSIGGLSAGCLAMTFGLFLATPRLEAGLFGQGNLGLSRTGLSQRVDVARGGAIVPDTTPVMRVEFPDEPNGTYDGAMYWRVTSLDSYVQGRWDSFGTSEQRRDRFGGLKFWRVGRNRVERAARTGLVREVRQVIYLDTATPDGLPCLPYVRSLESADSRLTWDPRQDYTVQTLSNQRSLEYEAVSEVPDGSPEALRAASDSYETVMRKADLFVLTNQGLEPRTVALTRLITANADTTYDRVVMIRDWFLKGDYVYSTEVPALNRYRAVDAFVREVKRGHCQLFASSMTLMLRSLGIPSRVVKGYRGGDWSPQDGAYFVTNSMAHLWVEVYFPNVGWVPFDPSPPAPSASVGSFDQFAAMTSRYTLNAKFFWYRNIVGYRGRILDWEGLRDTGRRLVGLEDQGPRLSRGSGLGTGFARAWPGLRTGVLFVLLAGSLAYLVGHRRGRPAGPVFSLTADQRRAVRVYGLLKRELGRQGLDCRGRTAEEILEEARDKRVLDAEPVGRVVGAYNAARFGGFPMERSRYLRLAAVVRSLRAASRT